MPGGRGVPGGLGTPGGKGIPGGFGIWFCGTFPFSWDSRSWILWSFTFITFCSSITY